MHKVMTRTAQHTPTRPPTRRDPRRPGTASPRGQGGRTSRTAPAAESAAPARDTPAAAPGQGAARTASARTPGQGSASTALTPPPSHRTAPTTPAPAAGRTPAHADPHTVPAQAARGRVPQPRPTDLFADRLLAVLSGQRPVHWMLRHTAGRAYDELARLAEHGPLRATRGTRPVVRDIGYYVAREGAVEAFARIGAGDQVRAMAFRLERGADLRWRCTAVELGGSRAPHPDDD
ncbi:Rv3235 family protein [Streptomyces sp. NPDC051572]|uniref:Rv3235 family protein n=1 Tax=Streptomyces sp. NPDC051572 TaxID=3155802 RepID=UPI00344E41E7